MICAVDWARRVHVERVWFSLLRNPWSFSPEADREFTARMRESFELGLAQGEVLGRVKLLQEFEAMLVERGDMRLRPADIELARKVSLH